MRHHLRPTHEIPVFSGKSVLDPPQIVPETTNYNVPMKVDTGNKKSKAFKVLGAFLLVFVVCLVLVGLLLFIPAKNVYQKGMLLAKSGESVKAAVATQDISVVKAQMGRFKADLTDFQKSYSVFAWTKALPIVSNYYKDGEAASKAGIAGIEAGELLLTTVEPYADIIGFKGASSKLAKSGEDNANNRLEFIVKTVKDIAPQIDEISKKAAIAESELKKIDPSRYPEEFRGIKVREELTKILSLGEEATSTLAKSSPIVKAAPFFLGVDESRKYLLVFQNDSELRPTGGFLSAYSILEVTKGKIRPVVSSDIYILDGKYTPTIPAPKIFRDYLAGIYVANNKFRLRDMNWSPDFKLSMETFVPEAKKAGLSGYDGIVVVDTKVLGYLLEVIGNVGVPGFGNFNTTVDARCNCPQFIYELQSYTSEEGAVVWSQDEPGKIIFAPKNYGKNRKDILGELMNSVLANTLGQSKEKLPKLFEAGWKAVAGKHVMVYMFDEEAQKALEAFNLAGRIQEAGGDYLHINNANLGGRKSNLYLDEEISQTFVKKPDGVIEKTLEITYKNTQKYDGFLNSVLPNYTRVYVPKGSKLVEAQGFETETETSEDLGKTVFSGGFKLRPEGLKKVTLKYTIPIKSQNGSLKLLIQKQGGVGDFVYTINSGRLSQEVVLDQDRVVDVRI